jgi:hypothetical protein
MTRRRAVLVTLCTSLFLVALGGGAPAVAAPPDPLDDDSLRGGNGTDTCVSAEVRLSSCER